MSKGTVYPGEAAWLTDPATGARVCQVTSDTSLNHATYFLHRSFLPGDRRLLFTSYRTGSAQLFLAEYPDGALVQLTGGPAIHPFSAVLEPSSQRVLFVRGGSIWILDLATLAESLVFALPGSLGEPSISADGEWVTAAYRNGDERGLVAGRVDGQEWRCLPFPRTVIHPQFHPLEPDWIEFAADPAPRMHRIKRDGSALECLYEHGNDEFVVHETFLGRTGDIVFVVWPGLLCRQDWTSRRIQTISRGNVWHISPNEAGTLILVDTNHPDEGIQIIDAHTGARRLVCLSQSSNRGTQWSTSRYALAEDFARALPLPGAALSWMESDGDTVYGPQWTHPHPSWSADESKIVFTSDRSGYAQVYVAESM